MEDLYIVTALIACAAGGFVIGLLRQSGRVARLQERADRTDQLEARLEASTTAEQDAEKRSIQLQAELDGLKIRLEERKETEEQQEAALKADEEKKKREQELMVARITSATHEILEKRTKSFDETSKKSIGELVKPLKEQLDGFRKQLKETGESASKERVKLELQVKSLTELNSQVSEEAQNLTKALKGDSQRRGAWGEMVLSRVLEASGLEEGLVYETQVSETTEDGLRRPDVIVHLPRDRQVVVDSKVSLVHYEAFCKAETSEEQEAAMALHIDSIRRHVKDLASKNYQHLKSITTVESVLMFMPIEAAVTEAFGRSNKLRDEVMAKNIIIVTPNTLLLALRTIETLWLDERRTRNSEEISEQAGKLYDKFVGFVETFEKVGTRIGQAQTEYDNAFGQLSKGRDNLVRKTEKLKSLGLKTKKSLPASLTDAAMAIEDDEPAGIVLDLVSDDAVDQS